MKKKFNLLIVGTIIISIILSIIPNAHAADIPISNMEIGNKIFTLTQTGQLYSSERDLSTQNKELIATDIKSIEDGNIITNNGDLYIEGILHKGLNAKKIIRSIGYSYVYFPEKDYRQGTSCSGVIYIDNYDNLKLYLYNSDQESTFILLESDIKNVLNQNPSSFGYRLLLHKNNGEVYLYEIDFSSKDYNDFDEMSEDFLNKFSKKFISSDIFQIANGSYDSEFCLLKNNGDLISFDFDKGTSEVRNSNINLSFGLITYPYSSVCRIACINNSGTMFSYYLGAPTSYTPGFAIKDFTYNADNLNPKFVYIDNNGLLYESKVYLGEYSKQDTHCLSKNIKFKKLYYNGAFALSENDELYFLSFNHRNADTLYKLSGVSVPIKIDSYIKNGARQNFMIIDRYGNSWGILENTTSAFLTSHCQKTIRILFNGNEIKLTQKIQNVNGRTMYPFRECLENMGVSVIWDQNTRTAIGEIPGKRIEFPIGKNEYTVNGIKYTMDTTSYIDKSLGKTYIPIRYAAEGLGFTVEWLPGETENVISIYK